MPINRSLVPLGITKSQSATTCLTASLHTVSYLYRHSTSASTARTHSTAEKRWLAVTAKIGTDPRMPDEWHHRTDKLRTTTITWEVGCIVVFVASALQQQKPLAPCTISTYLSGVRKYLENEGVDTSNGQNDPKLLRSARSQSNHCPKRSLHRHVDWRHGRGPRIGIPTNPERHTCAHHEPRSV